MKLFLFYIFIDCVTTKLLQINEWHNFDLEPGQHAFLDFSLFQTCQNFSLILSTARSGSTLFRFYFDDEILEKIDVDSILNPPVPDSIRVQGGCREFDRKPLTMNISSAISDYSMKVDEQLIRRPKTRFTNTFKILIPQDVPCCLIHGILITDNLENELVHSSTGKTYGDDVIRIKTTTESSKEDHKLHPQLITPYDEDETSTREFLTVSWTDVVNHDWSMTFLIYAYATVIFMCSTVLFGLAMFIYLQTKPPDADKLFTVDEPF